MDVVLVLIGMQHSCPADILAKNRHLGKPAAFDHTITSPLSLTTLTKAGVRCGSSALVAEARKHNANDAIGVLSLDGWILDSCRSIYRHLTPAGVIHIEILDSCRSHT